MTKPGASALFEVLARLPERASDVPASALSHPSLATAAARHGVAGWLTEGLAGRTLPTASSTELTRHAREAFSSATRIKRLTLKVFDAMIARRIVPVALKGSVLAARLFPANPLLRPSSDVDLLVAPEAVDDARHALEDLGLSFFVDTASGDHLDDHHHFSFTGPAGLVELHFRLTNTFGRGLFDQRRVLGRCMPYRFEGRDVLVLGPEDEFLYLATHAANHAFMRAAWLVDLQQYLLRFPRLDFEVMAVRAADAGFTAAVSATLGLLEELLHVALPESAHRAFPIRRGLRRLDGVVFSADRVESGALAQHALSGFALRLFMVDSPARGALHVADGAMRYARRALAKRLPAWPLGAR